MSTNAQLTHKWVTWTDWSQIKQVLLCLALVPKWAGGNFDAISDAWRSWTTRQRKIMTWHPLCNLPRHWRFWPTKCVWIQSFPWWIFFLIKAIWHKFVFNQCLAPEQCIGYWQTSTHTTIKKARPGVPNRAWSKTREAFDRVLDGDGKLPPPQASSTDATQLVDAIKDCSINALKYYAR